MDNSITLLADELCKPGEKKQKKKNKLKKQKQEDLFLEMQSEDTEY